MNIWISRELPLFNFKLLEILCAWIGLPGEKLWPLEFLESFHCWTSRVSICYALDSAIRVKSYDHLNFSRASVVQFRASWYTLSPNRTSELKVMTIWISRELSMFNFERLDILYPKLDIRVKSYCRLNVLRASILNYKRLDILRDSIGYPS